MKEGWEAKKLVDICKIQYGYPFDSKQFCDDSKYPQLIRIRDVSRGYSETYFSGEIPEGYYIDKGDYLIGMDGEFNIAAWNSERALLNQRVCKITANNEAFDRFLYYNLRIVLKQIEDETPFVTVKHLSAKRLNGVTINLPPLSEQKYIVNELDLLSSIIEKKKAQIKELDNLAQSLFYEMFGDPITNDKGWEIKIFGEVVVSSQIGLIRSAKQQGQDKSFAYFKMNNITISGDIDLTNLTRVDASEEEQAKFFLKQGDFLFNTRNSYELVGKSCVYNVKDNNTTLYNNNLLRILFNSTITPIYISYLFKDKFIKKQLDSIKKGTTSVWAIYYKDLSKIKILAPPLSIQQQFTSKIEAIEYQKELIKQSIKEVETLFNSRMDYYFN